MLQPGQPAPDFELYSDEHKPVRLSRLRGVPVVLVFFPGAFTTTCTRELSEINDRLVQVEMGALHVFGISTDSPFALAAYRARHGFAFPLLSDHDAEVCEAYGVKYPRGGAFPMGLHRIAKRAVFVLDAEGQVVHAEVLEDASEMPDLAAVAAAVGR